MKNLTTYIKESEQSQLKYSFKKKYNELYNKITHNFTPKNDILLISMCGHTKDKNAKNKKIPAKNLFIGPANTILADTIPNLNVDWIILSGGYGLMHSDTMINFYDDVIMNLSDTTLKELKDFCKYESDLINILKKANYKKIILTLSDTWMIMLDFENINKYLNKNCEIIGFLTDKRLNDKDFKIPENFININIKEIYLKKFGAGMISIKEKIVSEYLKYLDEHDYKNISIETFIKNYNK